MNNYYDRRYDQEDYYWGVKPSATCYRILDLVPADHTIKLLDVVFSTGVQPFIAGAPDAESTSHSWISGELLNHYQDWRIEFTTEEIFDCMSSGVPHQHAISRVVARKEIE